jgi:uncharacterized membrane protein
MRLDEGQVWLLIGLLAVMTAATKAIGPAVFGGRALPRWAAGVIAAMAPALLAGLVATAILSDGDRWAVGAETVGVGVAAVLLVLRVPLVPCVVVAVGLTAGLRALF